MEPTATVAPAQETLPDHTQLPDKDGSFVRNFQEPPQSELVTSSLSPRLQEIHPDGQFCIGCDSGIYYWATSPPLDGCKAPDWFYVPGVPPMLEGQIRRSYVLWKELVKPLLLIEYVSGDGSEERDRTPRTGKFWVYEQGICAWYYAIFEPAKASVEVYQLLSGRYQPVPPSPTGRFLIAPLRIELGVWEGEYRDLRAPWLRAWDADTGQLLLSAEERALAAKERADTAESLLDDTRQLLQEETERAETERRNAAEVQRRLEDEKQRAAKLAERLRALGIDPDAA
jgi:Uma2 family endonuclease